MLNRRNLYRLLHVQHDAPAPVIKASYRTIMQTLRQHPDLGGSADVAQVLNDAVATLCDPARRERYDRERAAAASPVGSGASSSRANTSTETTRSARTQSESEAPPPDDASNQARDPYSPGRSIGLNLSAGCTARHISVCLFCKAAVPTTRPMATGAYGDDSVCQRCGGARHVATRQTSNRDLLTRDGRRTSYVAIATLWTEWPLVEPIGVRIIDISESGAAVQSRCAIEPLQSILLKSSAINAIADIRYSEPCLEAGWYRCGLSLHTLKMQATPGDQLSISA